MRRANRLSAEAGRLRRNSQWRNLIQRFCQNSPATTSVALLALFRALKLWLSLKYHGRRAFREAIVQDLRHAQLLAEEIKSRPDLELLAPIPLSAVCFRHRRKDNLALLRRVIARGRVYLSNATVGDQFALRACFVNHRTTEADVRTIISEEIEAADELDT